MPPETSRTAMARDDALGHLRPRASRRWRFWLPRVMLLGGALYASLLLLWWTQLGLLHAQDDHVRSVVPVEAAELKSEAAVEDRDVVLRWTRQQVEQKMFDQQTRSPEQLTEEQQLAAQRAEEHARSVKMLPEGETKKRQLRCIGWRATGGCSPHGPREPERDAACSKAVATDESGYCEVEDATSGERFRVLRRYCRSLHAGAVFRCADAPDFAQFALEAQPVAAQALAADFALPNVMERDVEMEPRDGIVMVVYPQLLASAYATIRALRDVLDCQLPIELWFKPEELETDMAALEPLQRLADNQEAVITFREIQDTSVGGFNAKIYAIYHSKLERVLFLDADNVPVRDPSYLFESLEFVNHGAIFWPDFWHPRQTIFNIHAQSLLWEVLGTPFRNMFEQESGQLLVDRRRHAAALELVRFYAFRRPSPFLQLSLVYGDKDLFRLAWLKLRQSFYMVETPPAIAGKVLNDSFCGMTMVQHDAKGQVLFLHRNSNKLIGERKRKPVHWRTEAVKRVRKQLRGQGVHAMVSAKMVEHELQTMERTPAPTLEPPEPDGLPDPVVWTHLLSFRNTSRPTQYRVDSYRAEPEFPEWQRCYGQRTLGSNPRFRVQEIADLSFAGLETELRRFALEATQLHQEKLDALAEAATTKE